MSKSLHFTKTSIETLPDQQIQYDVKDRATPGLIVRVNPGGIKTFMFFRRINGRLKRIKIGRAFDVTVEQARKIAITYNSELIAGVDPFIRKKQKRTELTFKQLYELYYSEHALINTKRPKETRATIEFHILPKMGSLRLSEVTRLLLKKHHLDQGTERGKQQANKVLNIVSAVFNFGIREGYFKGMNPTLGIKRFKSRSRDRFLSPHELGKFMDALKYEDRIFQDFFLLSLFVGARKSTMLTMRYSQIDFDLRRWRLSEDESKNNDVNVYTLCDAALEILQRRIQDNADNNIDNDFVFPGQGKQGHLVDPKRSFKRIKTRMGVVDLRIHDLRRTLASYMAINNTSLPIIGYALNHKSQASTQIYARLTTDPIRMALNQATSDMARYLTVPAN